MRAPAARLRAFAETLWRKRSLRAMGSTMAAAITGRLLMLVMTVLVARQLGPEDFGVFSFAVGLAYVAAQLGALGWPMLLLKMIPTFIHQRAWSHLRGINVTADRVVLASTTVLASSGVAVAFGLLDSDNPLRTGILVAAAIVVPTGARLLNRQRMAAIGRAATGLLFDESAVPLVVIAALLLLPMRSPLDTYIAYGLGAYLSAFAARAAYRRWRPPAEAGAERTVEFRSWMAVALPMLTAVAASVLLDRIDTLMLAPLSSATETGLYNTAYRIAFLATLLPAMVNPVVRPMLAAAFAAGRHDGLRRVMWRYYLFTGLVAAPISLIMIVFAEELLFAIFGAEFVPAAPTLRVLAVATFLWSLVEASASFLLMCNKERVFGALSVLALVLKIGLNFWLIPDQGTMGAAISTLTTNIVLIACSALVVFFAMRGLAAASGNMKAE